MTFLPVDGDAGVVARSDRTRLVNTDENPEVVIGTGSDDPASRRRAVDLATDDGACSGPRTRSDLLTMVVLA